MDSDRHAAAPDSLQARLDRWMGAGIVTADQAAAIAAFESANPHPAGARALDGRRGRAVEALGYVGGAVVAAALVILTVGYWDRIDRAWQLLIPAVAAVALFAAGLASGGSAGGGDVASRLRAVLWLGSSAATAVFLGVLMDTLAIRDRWGMLIVSGGLLVQAVPLWLTHRRAPQQIAVFVGAMMLASAAASHLRDLGDGWDVAVGIAMAVVALGWAIVAALSASASARASARASADAPARASAERRWGLCLGVAGASVGAIVLAASGTAPWLGIVAVAAALALALAVGDLVALGIAAIGTMIVLPMVIDHYLDSTVLMALTLLVAGLAMVALAVAVARRGRRGSSSPVG